MKSLKLDEISTTAWFGEETVWDVGIERLKYLRLSNYALPTRGNVVFFVVMVNLYDLYFLYYFKLLCVSNEHV